MDAKSLSRTAGVWSSDLSRSQDEGALFAMAFNPGSCSVHASIDGAGPVQLHDYGVNSSSSSHPTSPGFYRAALNWPPMGDDSAKWNLPIHAGLFLENGSLTLYRLNGNGPFWHSSGIICKNLPERVVPCMFMCSFVGHANVKFVKIWDSPPDVCPCCYAELRGTKSGWGSLPR